jgi:ATP-dependent helicase/nuclease subunit A
MPRLTVIRASAGSGKTFSLTQEYLRLIITQPDSFKHILAVTFTNKATEEMKSRIIHELFLLSSNCESKQLNLLIQSTGQSETSIRRKSQSILKQLLHQYSLFSINTIDTFFQKIIRNFTRELGIQEGYVIELETEPVLTEIIDRLLVNAEHDTMLLDWLTVFAESLIEKGENWNLKRSIRKLGNEIFREEFKSLDKETINMLCDKSSLKEYRNSLITIQKQAESKLKSYGLKALDIIKSHGLTIDDFSNKSRGPAGYFVRIASGEFAGPSDAVSESIIRKEKWYSQSSSLKKTIENLAVTELMPLLENISRYYNENLIMVNTASVILKNLYTLGIVIDLSRLADNWCFENNTFLLTEAPAFLNRIIDSNDTPFIYEKAGFWFHHFMIDEFQDTSVMQWNNFKPLISNSLSQGYDNLAVGDIKQSIYRWRNSSWEILENKIKEDFLPGILNQVNLSKNYRSRENIVKFNNTFFSYAAHVLQDDFDTRLLEKNAQLHGEIPSLKDLYRDLEQQPARAESSGGYVNVQFIKNGDDADYLVIVMNEVVKAVHELLETGYQLKDIAILTRKNKEAADLADFILKDNTVNRPKIRVISDEALHLGSSVIVNTLISLLKYIADPEDYNNNYFLSSISTNYIKGKEGVSWTLPEYNHHNKSGLKLPVEFLELVKGSKSYSLVEIIERVIFIFRLDAYEGEMVYIMAFRDLIQEYIRNHSSNIIRFLEFWDEIGSKRSVSAPAGQDALRILTLHKAKGLEFKITIIPYCTWEFNTFDRSFLWCKPDQSPFDKLTVLPINFTRKLAKTIFADEYYRELHKQLVDNLNLMYVAFTRARDAMYIFCRETKSEGLSNASSLTRMVLSDKMNHGITNYEYGNLKSGLSDKIQAPVEMINYQQSQDGSLTERLKIAFQGKLVFDPETNKPARPLNEGRILHEIFNKIITRENIKSAVANLHMQGKIGAEEQTRYIRLIENAMNDLQVSTWFAGDWRILNEAEIIVPGGEIRRPDRVMQKNGQTLIVDYKFGLKAEAIHETQVREYAELLKNMGSTGIEAYLWYVRMGRVVQVKI